MLPNPGRALRLALVLVAVAVSVAVGPPSVVGAEELPLSPSMTVNPVTISAGDKVTVIGEGWPSGQLVDLSICGNGGDGGSANCNRSGAATVGVGGDGRFGATLVGVVPPVACPCVVRGAAGVYSATQPIQVVGAPLRTAPEAIAVPLVTAVQVSGSGPAAAWFGGSPERDVVVAVSNPSEGVVRDARVEVRWGSGGSEQSTVVPVGQDLDPGAEIDVATTIALGALTWGVVSVRARVVTTGDPTWVEAETSSYPWGLLVVALVLLQVLVVVVVRRNRRARRVREEELSGVTPPDTETEPLLDDDVPVTGPAVEGPTGDDAPPVASADTDQEGAASVRSEAVPVRPDAEPVRPAIPIDDRLEGPVTAAPWH